MGSGTAAELAWGETTTEYRPRKSALYRAPLERGQIAAAMMSVSVTRARLVSFRLDRRLVLIDTWGLFYVRASRRNAPGYQLPPLRGCLNAGNLIESRDRWRTNRDSCYRFEFSRRC